MRIGKLIGKTLALPVKAVVSVPDVAADVIEEIGKAAGGKEPKQEGRG